MNKTEILKIMDLLEKNKQAELNEYLKEQLLLVNMKASGGNTEVKRYKTAMRYIKNITDNRPTMKCAHVIDGVQYLTDSFTGFALTNHIEGLPASDGGYPDLKSIIDGARSFGVIGKLYDLIPLAEIKTRADLFKKKTVAKAGKDDYININGSYFNPCYLLNLLNILGGDDDIQVKSAGAGSLRPVTLENSNGCAIIVPVRMD